MPIAGFNALVPIFDVRSYQAVGDGVADDTAAIQAAINAAHAAQTRNLYMGPSDYRVTSTITFPAGDRWNIYADGARLRPTGAWTGPVVKIGDPTGVTRTNFLSLNGLHIMDNGATGVTTGLDLYEIFNSDFHRVLVESMPGDGWRFNAKGYNNVLDHCISWLNDGDGVLDLSSGSERWTPTFMEHCRFEGNGKHGIDWGSDMLFMSKSTLQSNAILANTYYDARIRGNYAELNSCQFEHTDPAGAGDERTMLFTDSGAIVIVRGGTFNGNRTGSFGHTGIKQTGKIVIMGPLFRDLKDSYVEQAASADTMLLGPVFINNINSVSVTTGSPTNFVALGGQLSPTLRSGFIEVQGAMRDSVSSGQPRFADSLGVRVMDFLEGEEIADPASPSANRGRLYYKDNGAGKTQLAVLFPTGAVQVLATEP